MPQPLRTEFAGAWFHVTARAVWGRELFADDEDRRFFLSRLARTVARYGWRCTGYCLLSTHHHLLVRLTRPNLAFGMQELHSVHARRFNARHGRRGHVFSERYEPTLMRDEVHVLQAHRYVALNPVAAGVAPTPEGWRWSSHAATVARRKAPALLDPRPLLELLAGDATAARARYATFVSAASAPTASAPPASASCSATSLAGASHTVPSGGSVTSADHC